MGKLSLITAVIELFSLIVRAIQNRQIEKDQEAHQEKVDQAREDPAAAFDEHFNNKKKGDH